MSDCGCEWEMKVAKETIRLLRGLLEEVSEDACSASCTNKMHLEGKGSDRCQRLMDALKQTEQY